MLNVVQVELVSTAGELEGLLQQMTLQPKLTHRSTALLEIVWIQILNYESLFILII